MLAPHPKAIGINIKAGEKPSTMQMLKLAANAEFRAASTKMMEEFKKAGVDVHDKVRGTSVVGLIF